MAGVCRSFKKPVWHPSQWRSISLYQKQQGAYAIQRADKGIANLLNKAEHLQVLSLKFCPHVGDKTLTLISDFANPFFFRELYLDGCDNITSLQNLVQNEGSINNKFLLEAHHSEIQISRFQALSLRKQDMKLLMEELSLGGARGLEVISLAECKGILDEGIKPLTQLKYLSKVILLGCLNIKNTGIKELAESLQYLEEIKLGGTMIETQCLHDLVDLCLNLRRVNISGCKQLKE